MDENNIIDIMGFMATVELILLGLFVGGVTGVTGASGVLILVPILSTFFDFSLPVILGTSLLVDVIASLSVSVSYARLKNLDIKSSVWILFGSLLGAQIGSFFVVSVSKILIMAVLSVCMIFFGVKILQNGFSQKDHSRIRLPERFSLFFRNPVSMVLAGLFIGLTTGIFGAGGGLTVFIFLYSILDFPIKKAVGTSSFIMLFTALSGMIGYVENGNLNIELGIIIGISAALGGAFSSVLANKLNENFLNRLVGGFFVLLALVMVILKVIFPLLSVNF